MLFMNIFAGTYLFYFGRAVCVFLFCEFSRCTEADRGLRSVNICQKLYVCGPVRDTRTRVDVICES